MQNALNELLEEYKSVTGKVFNAHEFPNPKTVPSHLIKLVSSIKVLSASARALEITAEIRKGEKVGDAYLAKEPLLKEIEHLNEEQRIWSTP